MKILAIEWITVWVETALLLINWIIRRLRRTNSSQILSDLRLGESLDKENNTRLEIIPGKDIKIARSSLTSPQWLITWKHDFEFIQRWRWERRCFQIMINWTWNKALFNIFGNCCKCVNFSRSLRELLHISRMNSFSYRRENSLKSVRRIHSHYNRHKTLRDV